MRWFATRRLSRLISGESGRCRSARRQNDERGESWMSTKLTRRSVTQGLALSATALAMPAIARAQAKAVKLAMVAPLSGPWARQGQLLRQGAEMARDEINQQGGIKALGGAKVELIVADAGDSTEKAKNAAQRLISDQPDLLGGFGSWLSSFTLAVTEVTEDRKSTRLNSSHS